MLETPVYIAEYEIENREILYDYLVEKHKRLLEEDPSYKVDGYSFRVDEHLKEFGDLYGFFYETAQQLLGPFTLTEDNKVSIWAQVSDRNSENSLHNHLETSVINSVYYLSVPDSNSGVLEFYSSNMEHIGGYQPEENKLIIFPNYLNHLPTNCDSDEFRIALNMEIICKESVWK